VLFARIHGLLVATPLASLYTFGESNCVETLLPSDGRFLVNLSRTDVDKSIDVFHVIVTLIDIAANKTYYLADSDCVYPNDAFIVKVSPDGKMIGTGNVLFTFAEPRAHFAHRARHENLHR